MNFLQRQFTTLNVLKDLLKKFLTTWSRQQRYVQRMQRLIHKSEIKDVQSDVDIKPNLLEKTDCCCVSKATSKAWQFWTRSSHEDSIRAESIGRKMWRGLNSHYGLWPNLLRTTRFQNNLLIAIKKKHLNVYNIDLPWNKQLENFKL